MSIVLQKIRQRAYSPKLLEMIHVYYRNQIIYRLPSIERIPYKVKMPHRKRAGISFYASTLLWFIIRNLPGVYSYWQGYQRLPQNTGIHSLHNLGIDPKQTGLRGK